MHVKKHALSAFFSKTTNCRKNEIVPTDPYRHSTHYSDHRIQPPPVERNVLELFFQNEIMRKMPARIFVYFVLNYGHSRIPSIFRVLNVGNSLYGTLLCLSAGVELEVVGRF